jgi:hypothetical protein
MRHTGRLLAISLSAFTLLPALFAQAAPPGAAPGSAPRFGEILRQRMAERRAAGQQRQIPQTGTQPTQAVAAPSQPVVPPTLNQQPAMPPQVSYQNGALSITAENSTLGDILREVQKRTGATIEVPPNAVERVVTRLGPAPPREVLASLLNGSSFNYVMVGSAGDPNALTTVMLSPRVGGPAPQPMQTAEMYQQPPVRTGFVPPPVAAPVVNDGSDKDEEDTDEAEDNSDEENGSAGQNVIPPPPQQQTPDGQQPPNAGPKTPQQIMEMLRQNRQQQKQDNQDQQDPQEQ